MHRCLVDCPAVEIEVELFRKRMCLIKKGRPRQKLADDADSKAKESRQGGYNGLKQRVEILEHARECQICPDEGKNDSIASSKQNSPSQKTCWWNERVRGGQRHVFRRPSSFLQELHAKTFWRCVCAG